MDDLKRLIREVPDFPKPGILFYDITTLLKDPRGLRGVIDGLKDHYKDAGVDLVIGIEARPIESHVTGQKAWWRIEHRNAISARSLDV